ncbi:hypothetical protein [Fibrobacter sp.]|uniref:hypothetical protein n=1 Tax=Fibrobacter sp. TaxID=35828 RepID=UPI00388EF0FA
MLEEKTEFEKQIEKTCADLKEFGFEFQFLYFVLKVLSMREGETVAWEVEDDVSIKLPDKVLILFQVKHSFDDNPKLTTLDVDLWKSFSNWRDLIEAAHNSEKNDFLSKTQFILVSNKKRNSDFLKRIEEFQTGEIGFSVIKKELEGISSNNDALQGYIENFKGLADDLMELFFKQLRLDLNVGNLLEECKKELRSKMVREENIEDVFIHILGALKKDHYTEISQKKKFSISFEDYYSKYRAYYDAGRQKLYVRKYECDLVEFQDQIFMKQLIDIGDVKKDDRDKQIKLTQHKYNALNNILTWTQNGDVTEDERNEFEENAVLDWENEYDYRYQDDIPENQYNKIGREILHAIRLKKLKLNGTTLETPLSNGTFYYLADEPKIGFRGDWKEKYGK